MSQAALPTHRENNFDAVRFIAAAAVIYGHAHPLTRTPDAAFWGNSAQSFAVKVFFVISGFLITASWLADPNPFRYFSKRALRIFPALAVVVALSALVLGPLVTTLPLSSYFANARVEAYFGNIALRPSYDLPGVFDRLPYPGAVNGSLWSLPAEFAMYLVLPLVCALGAKLRFRWLPALATVGLCAWSLYWNRAGIPHRTVVIYGTSLASALDAGPYFLLGASYQIYGLRRFLSPVVALGLLGIGVFLQPSTALAMELGLYLLAPYAILSFALSPAPVFSRAGRWGDFSYGLYLYGFPLQQTFNFLWPHPMTSLQNAAVAGLAALLFAVLSWHLVEKRMLAMKPSRRRTVPVVAQGGPG
jgi:peptidoglycan/LPS O-acetylase OafA/YrhL